MSLNYLIWTFVKPSHLILLVAILGVVLWRKPLGRWCRGAAVILIVVFGLLPTAAWLMRPLETRFPIPPERRVDGIVVLAGAEIVKLSDFYGQPQVGSRGDRLLTFLALAARYPDARLVFSGRNESAVGRDVILGAGIDPGRVSFEDASTNTCESARETRELVQPAPSERWLLVTSSFHLPRAMGCFRAAAWEVVPYPADFRRGPSAFHWGLVANLEDLDLAAHEWLGLVYYRVRGHTDELFPAPRRP
ncbi:MAG TPA: YdcF family protein [Gammaproteobacteria bacterium]|nr:YdcF family protein [Gammaproteobacteria bacterium]